MEFLKHFKERNLERRINQIGRAQDPDEIYDCAHAIVKLSETIYDSPMDSPHRKEYILSYGILEDFQQKHTGN